MSQSRSWRPGATLAVAVVLAAAFHTTPLRADTVQQLNLAEMIDRAALIYRGAVLSATPGTLSAGGGELPIVTYRLRVEETFRGDVPETKGVRIAEIRMLGKATPVRQGALQWVSRLPQMPRLVVGQSYLVLTTAPSALGLSTTVGLGQGCFHVVGRESGATAVNEVGNRGLFRDMTLTGPRVAAAPGFDGPLSYDDLAREIRVRVGR